LIEKIYRNGDNRFETYSQVKMQQ